MLCIRRMHHLSLGQAHVAPCSGSASSTRAAPSGQCPALEKGEGGDIRACAGQRHFGVTDRCLYEDAAVILEMHRG